MALFYCLIIQHFSLFYCLITQHFPIFYCLITHHFSNYPEAIKPIAVKFFQKLNPLCTSIQDAFAHRMESQSCDHCKEAKEEGKDFCRDGYVFFDKSHNAYCTHSEANAKCNMMEPRRVLRNVATDLFQGIDHTEKLGFHDKVFRSNLQEWRSKYGKHMDEKEQKFKGSWERKRSKEDINMEDAKKKAASGGLKSPPIKLRRVKNQKRKVSQQSSDSSSSEYESDDSSVGSVHTSDSDSE